MLDNTGLFIRTDMADEAKKLWENSAADNSTLKGVSAAESELNGLELCEVEILDRDGEKLLHKPQGKYFSLSLPQNFERGSADFSNTATAVATLIKRCYRGSFDSVLVAALGNPDITPDALGNCAASNILVTSHLDRKQFPQFSSLSLCRTGVLGTSGIESAEHVKALCAIVRPSLVIVIDALAGSDADRLCRCIQISNTGISPGSGVGNNRAEISRSVLGVPVISIGIPTVIDAQYFGSDKFAGMFVSPRNIDSLVRNGAKLIAYGINLAVHNGLNIEDIDALVG